MPRRYYLYLSRNTFLPPAIIGTQDLGSFGGLRQKARMKPGLTGGKESRRYSDIYLLCACNGPTNISVRRALYQTAEMIRLWNGFHEKLGNEVQTTFDPAQW
jgi:hypothetical protein